MHLLVSRFEATSAVYKVHEIKIGDISLKEFDTKTAEEIGYYVYCLVDPRTKKPFYVGKGKENRVFAHARDALEQPNPTDKLDTIREIIKTGQQVGYLIVQHGMTEETAFAVETALIDFAGHFDLGLTNIVLGHKSSAFGIMTADEVQLKYKAEPLDALGDGCVIININRTYKRAKGSKSFYEATKESWVISEKRIPTLKYVLSEYGGFIVEVFEVNHDGWYKTKDPSGKARWGFNGKQASDEIRDRYLNRSIVKKPGAANPIAYKLSLP
jgi:hypothetical protein